ncbi:MAG: universal stress protein [Myxococcaceae bacterium]
MKRILVAIDGSREAGRALKVAIELSRALGARLTLAHAAPRPAAWAEDDLGNDRACFESAYARYARDLLLEAKEGAGGQGVEAELLLVWGPPAEAVADAAKAQDADLVVAGSRGRGAVSRALLGSVSNRLMHICSRPVLVVR